MSIKLSFYLSAFLLGFLPTVFAEHPTIAGNMLPEKQIDVAKADEQLEVVVPQAVSRLKEIQQILSTQQVSQNELETALHYALNQGDMPVVALLLNNYQKLPDTDPILIDFAQAQLAQKAGRHTEAVTLYRKILAQAATLTPVRIQLATSLFYLNEESAAREQFEKALSDPQLPADIHQLVTGYLAALNRRNEWQFHFSAHYLRENNVNNASNEAYIENTPFKKNAAMLPQKAHGVAYAVGMEREFHLKNPHFLHFSQDLSGKYYWDNRDFDEISSRTYLGYVNKGADYRFALLPFYDQLWFGGHRYKSAYGVRANWQHWFNPHWQLSTALEYGRQHYFSNEPLNGHHKLASLTLLWRINPECFIYSGVDVSQERTRIRQYSYDLKTLRAGWGEEWQGGISSRLSLSYSERAYKADFALANGAFRFDKVRQDRIYQAGLTLWKRDWHIWGGTPKLHMHWKKQVSNLPTLYSYQDKNITFLVEKSF